MEYYKKTRWEGESWAYKAKYAYAKYPFLVLSSLIFFIGWPIVTAIRVPRYENSRYHALTKYKSYYWVFRDDDPNLEAIIKQKELGRHHFPKY